MKVPVTGGAGYFDNKLVPHLFDEGRSVTGQDCFFFGQGRLSDPAFSDRLTLVRDDIHWFDGKLMRGFDALVDMAADRMILGRYGTWEVPVIKDGTQWRPLVHVRDVTGRVRLA